MTLKRLIALLLAVLMVFSLLTVLTACDSEDDDRRSSSRRDKDDDDDEDEDEDEDKDRDEAGESHTVQVIEPEDLEWEVTDDGIKLTNYTGNDAYVQVPDTIEGKKVVSLGTAFAGNVTVKVVVLGAYIDRINGDWFEGCDSLVGLIGPNVTEMVGEELDCEALETLVLPSLAYLNLGDIEDCESLRYLEIPNVEAIVCYSRSNWEMYLWPESLESVVIPGDMLARVDAFCEWDDDVPYEMICSLAVEDYLDDAGEVDFDDPRYAGGYVTMDEDELNLFYCNFFQQSSITVNGETYELD